MSVSTKSVLGVTGHRPQKLYGFDEAHPGNNYVITAIGQYLKAYKPDEVITGMAIGVDQWVARWCVMLKIPFVAALPFKGQEGKWPAAIQEMYNKLLKKAAEVVVVSPEDSTDSFALKMQKRNEYIVNRCSTMLGVFGGSQGGTLNCLQYAKEKGKHIDIINPGNYFQSSSGLIQLVGDAGNQWKVETNESV